MRRARVPAPLDADVSARTNGNAEQLVRTLLAEWAYAELFTERRARVTSASRFLDSHNRARPHWSLAGQPPIIRMTVNNPREDRLSYIITRPPSTPRT